MHFIQNKYTNWYYGIIAKASARIIDSYTETHHIVPRSLGGSNSKENLVKLTAREHFICHWLLTKMLTGANKAKMVYAVWSLSNQNNPHQKRNKISSRKYEILRKEFIAAKTGSKAPGSFYRKINEYWTDENRAIHAGKISKVTRGRKLTEATKEKHRNKIWTESAKTNRLNNCLKSAAERKGKKNPEHGETIFKNYVEKNKELIKQIWELFDQGSNRRQISIQLGITWDRVNVAINKRAEIEKHL